MFTDSIEENLDTIRELLQGVPVSARNTAKRAAVTIENAFERIKKDAAGDAAAALGAAFAIYMLAKRMVEQSQDTGASTNKSLIHLLS